MSVPVSADRSPRIGSHSQSPRMRSVQPLKSNGSRNVGIEPAAPSFRVLCERMGNDAATGLNDNPSNLTSKLHDCSSLVAESSHRHLGLALQALARYVLPCRSACEEMVGVVRRALRYRRDQALLCARHKILRHGGMPFLKQVCPILCRVSWRQSRVPHPFAFFAKGWERCCMRLRLSGRPRRDDGRGESRSCLHLGRRRRDGNRRRAAEPLLFPGAISRLPHQISRSDATRRELARRWVCSGCGHRSSLDRSTQFVSLGFRKPIDVFPREPQVG